MKGSTGGGRVSEQCYNITLKNHGPQERGKTFESSPVINRAKNQAKGKR